MKLHIQLPALHKSQEQVKNHPSRFKVMSCGRRWGKTRLGALLCISVALRGGVAWWVAPTYKVAAVGWRILVNLAVQIPGAQILKADKIVILPGGGLVQVRSADDPNSLRGDALHFVVLDEVAFMKEEAWTEAIRPALSDYKGSALFISTPSGRNWFWKLWMKGKLGENPDWSSWQLPTSDNPFIDKTEIEEARRDLPELTFEQEYLAVFLENEGQVFRHIARSLWVPDSYDPGLHKGHSLVAGVDWAKEEDFTAISVGCRDCAKEVEIVRFNDIDYNIQSERLKYIVKKWDISQVLAEENSMGAPIIDRLFSEGVPIVGFTTTSSSKPPLIESLALSIEEAEIALIDDPVWTGELESYERKRSPITGRSQYMAATGFHDDTVMARALMREAVEVGIRTYDNPFYD